VAHQEDFTRLARQTAFMTVALLAALVFGIVLLASGDWVPGGIIVAATLVGLGRQIPIIWKLCSEGPAPSPPKSKPTG
jgi:hypothetical protein